jgi:hypothetical protein
MFTLEPPSPLDGVMSTVHYGAVGVSGNFDHWFKSSCVDGQNTASRPRLSAYFRWFRVDRKERPR